MAYAVALLRDRPVLDGEGELLHEAGRLRMHLPLYTDPQMGAFDQGPYPSRVYVVYPPLWSWVADIRRPEATCYLAEGPLPDALVPAAVHTALAAKFTWPR